MLVNGSIDFVRSGCPLVPGFCSYLFFESTCLSHDTPLSEQVGTCAQAAILDEPFCIGELCCVAVSLLAAFLSVCN